MLLRAEHLEKIYRQGDARITALRDVSLTLPEHGFTAVVGASGSGKSTLLRTLAALDAPDEGHVFYDDTDIYALSERKRAVLRRRKLGIIFQDFGLLPTLTVMENICTPALMDGQKPDIPYLMEVCELLGIRERLHHIPSELSGGEQQRTAAARALCCRPAVLFADEPTGNLDEASAKELISLLLDTRAELGQTLVMVTHDKSIAAMADSVYSMQNGVLKKL